MSQVNLQDVVKEDFLGNGTIPPYIADSESSNSLSHRRFPFVFSMPVQFYTQADVVAYLKQMSLRDTDNEDGLESAAMYDALTGFMIPSQKDKLTEEGGFIASDRAYAHARYSDALTPSRNSGAYGVGDDSRADYLGIDPIFTRPNQLTTEIGGNDAINCYWQFNWDDDLVPPMLSANPYMIHPETGGLGRVYSEMYNTNQQLIHISVGVPRYTNLVSFYSSLFSRQLHSMNTDGESFMSSLGRLIGSGVGLAISLVVAPWRYVLSLINHISDDQITKYVDFHESMLLYYRYVNSVLIELAVNMGLMPKIFNSAKSGSTSTEGTTSNMSLEKTLNEIIPTMELGEAQQSHLMPIFRGGFDIYRILSIKDTRERASTSGISADPRINGPSADRLATKVEQRVVQSNKPDEQGNVMQATEVYINGEGDDEEPGWFDDVKDWFKAFGARASATWQGADKFVSFKMEKSTNSSESLSNSTGESPVQSFFNSKSDESRSGREFTGGGAFKQFGNILGSIPVIGEAMAGVLNGVQGILDGARDSMPIISGAASIVAGEAKVDIPEVWQSSSFSKSYNFNISLRAPYGDKYTIFQSIYIPLVMLLCMALPRASGSNSYVQPFVIRAYSKGMFAIPYGIIESMSITRGASEFGWNRNRLPTVVEVSFTIRDLSPFMVMAPDMGASLLQPWNLINNIFGDNTSFQEYLMTLSGMGLSERLLWTNQINRRLTTVFNQIKSKFSSDYIGSLVGDSPIGRIIGAISPNSALPN